MSIPVENVKQMKKVFLPWNTGKKTCLFWGEVSDDI
jgi:hypothetical protein